MVVWGEGGLGRSNFLWCMDCSSCVHGLFVFRAWAVCPQSMLFALSRYGCHVVCMWLKSQPQSVVCSGCDLADVGRKSHVLHGVHHRSAALLPSAHCTLQCARGPQGS